MIECFNERKWVSEAYHFDTVMRNAKGPRKFHFLFEKAGLTRFGGLSLFTYFANLLLCATSCNFTCAGPIIITENIILPTFSSLMYWPLWLESAVSRIPSP
jgi:hypothetical protein